MSSKRSRRRNRSRPREYFTPAAVIVSIFCAALGIGLAGLCVVVLAGYIQAGVTAFDTVGAARPMPYWFAVIGIIVGFFGGLSLGFNSLGYLYRVARGRVPKPDKHLARRTP